jgi:hypothetical protein
MYDYSDKEYSKWTCDMRDRRGIKDLGSTAIDIFDLDKIILILLFNGRYCEGIEL